MDAKGAAKMTRRYKGRPSAKTIARDFPFIVELAVPLGGWEKAQFDALISRSTRHPSGARPTQTRR
jgi:hypothetical protein